MWTSHGISRRASRWNSFDMRTEKQNLGDWGEALICQKFDCPKCKRKKTLKKLPVNFKCADIICDFCGYLAQVKTKSVKHSEALNVLPKQILAAAWGPQKERMDAGIYFPLFLALKLDAVKWSVFYVPSDLQLEKMFVKRKPLSQNAKRAGWEGYYLDGALLGKFATRLF